MCCVCSVCVCVIVGNVLCVLLCQTFDIVAHLGSYATIFPEIIANYKPQQIFVMPPIPFHAPLLDGDLSASEIPPSGEGREPATCLKRLPIPGLVLWNTLMQSHMKSTVFLHSVALSTLRTIQSEC